MRKRGGRKKRGQTRPSLTLKSFVLQEAEAVGREAKIRTAAAMGLRAVSLQHDGIAVMGLDGERREEVARAMGEAVTAACGYTSTVTVKEVIHGDAVD